MPAKKSNKNMKKKGGSGAAEHGINVFGGIGQQGPISANDNTIAMKQVSGGSRKGGSVVVDVGAPLILTGLNQYMKRRSAKKGGKKVGGKCSLKGGKKVKFGGKSKKIMKKGKWGGKRRSMKKRSGKKMKGAGPSVGTDNDDSDDNNEERVFQANIEEVGDNKQTAVVDTEENKNELTAVGDDVNGTVGDAHGDDGKTTAAVGDDGNTTDDNNEEEKE